MILNSPYITGSITITGNANVQGTLTVTGSLSGTATSASLALNSNLLQGTGSTGFSTTASLLAVSSSQQQISSSYIALSASYNTFSGSASTRVTQIENTYATTGSNSFRANQSITGSLVVSSTITAQTLVVQTVTSSIVYSSGSNIFGSALTDRQTFTGSVNITGSLTIGGVITSTMGNNSRVFLSNAATTGYVYTNLINTTGNFYTAIEGSTPNTFNPGTTAYASMIGTGTATDLQFYTNNTLRLTITSSGNIGIGTATPGNKLTVIGTDGGDTTPATYGGTIKIVDYGVAGPQATGGLEFRDSAGYGSKIYTNSANDYLGFASRLGSATWTEHMVIKQATGNVGIGTSSPVSLLHLKSVSLTIAKTAIGDSTEVGRIDFRNDYMGAYTWAQIKGINGGTHDYSNIVFSTTNGFNSLTEKMRITSGGKVGIGVTNPNYSLTVAGSIQAGYILLGDTGNGVNNTIEMTTGTNSTTYSAGHIQYYSNGYLTICYGGGNVYIGATSGAYKLTLNGQPGANGYTNWTNYSDSRLKENITDLEASNILDKICAIRPVTFNYNELSGFDETTRSRRISGFIAQELMEKFPDMIGTIKLDNTEYYDTNLSNLNLYLVKAIQELKAEIDELKNK